MTGLLDIGPLTEEVPVGKASLTVSGLSAEDLFHLIAKYPDLRSLMDPTEGATVSPDKLLSFAPVAVSEAAACATGERGNDKAAEAFRRLGVATQLSIINAVLRLTFPEGAGPFVVQLKALTAMVGVQDSNSPGQSPDALLMDEPRPMPGTLPRAS